MENKQMLIGLVIAGLLLIALFQGLQLYTARENNAGGQAITGNAVQGNGQQASVPANLQNLPSMVGGC